MPCLQPQSSQQRNDIKMPPMRRFHPNLGFRPETPPNQCGSREVSTHLNDASKEGNDAHGRRRRRHRQSGLDFRLMPHTAHAARRIGAADLVVHTAAATTLCHCNLTMVLHQLPAWPRRTRSQLHLQPRRRTAAGTTNPPARNPDRAQEGPRSRPCASTPSSSSAPSGERGRASSSLATGRPPLRQDSPDRTSRRRRHQAP
jgi:hypothetical protein